VFATRGAVNETIPVVGEQASVVAVTGPTGAGAVTVKVDAVTVEQFNSAPA
jgi:hypothetical protein